MGTDDMTRKRNMTPMLAKALEMGAAMFVGEKAKKMFRKNPSDMESAEQMSSKWHGRKPKNVTEIVEEERYTETVAELADLEELGFLDSEGEMCNIVFKRDRPKLVAIDDENLEFIGGDQKLDLPQIGIEEDGKTLIPIGYCYSICYETDKHHLEDSNGTIESYEHYWGEEFYKESHDYDDYENPDEWFEQLMEDGKVDEAIKKGLLPMLVYNQTDEKILLVGGKYEVTDLGIKN